MRVTRLDFSLNLNSLTERWNDLLSRSGQHNIFLTLEWLSLWWSLEGAGCSLYLLSVEDSAGELVGAAPLMVKEERWLGKVPIREIAFLGSGRACSDHLDFLARSGLETEVAVSIGRYLREHQSEWDVLHLTGLRENSATPAALMDYLGREYRWEEQSATPCPYLPIMGTWDAFLRTKGAKFRKKLRYERRVFDEKLKGQFRACETAEEVSQTLGRMSQLNAARWRKSASGSAFADRRFAGFHEKVALGFLTRGWLRLTRLDVGGEIGAVLYAFAYGGKIFFYNSAFDPRWARYSPGSVLLGCCVEKAFDEGVEEFDFLRGSSAYKQDWTSLMRYDRSVLVVSPGKRVLLWQTARSTLNLVRTRQGHRLPQPVRRLIKRVMFGSRG